MPEDKTPLPENSLNPQPGADAAADAPADMPVEEPEGGDIETESVEMVACPGCHAEIDTSEVPAFSTIACPACGASLDVPAKFGAFRLLKKLGSGGMGSVFLGQDSALDRKVAIKVVKRSLGANPKMMEAFQREAQATARLNHPNIVQIYAFGEEKGQPYIAMELVGGGSLDGLIEARRRLDPAFVLRVGKEIATGLEAAKEAGLIHGDVKPENILFDENWRAKLVDFGIASALSGDSDSKEIWGTPYYIAPEKAKGKKADIRSDLYSLGATLYHALTLHPPFDGPDASAVVAARFKGPAAPIAKYRPDVDRKAAEIIERMMHSNPMVRFPTVGSLVASIDEYLKTVPAERAEKPGTATVSSRLTAARAPAAAASGSVGAAPAGTSNPTKRGKKIIIAKGGGRSRLTVSAAPSQEPIPAAPVEDVPVADAEEPFVPEMPPPVEDKPSGNRGVKIAIGCGATVIVLAVIAAIVGLLVVVRGEKETGKENAARAEEARQVERDADKLNQKVSAAAAEILKIDAEARKVIADVEHIVSEATEMPWKAPSLDPTEEILIDPPSPAAASAEQGASSSAEPAASAPPDNLKALKDDPALADSKFSAARKAIIAFAMDHADLAKSPELIQALLAVLHDPENAKDADMMEIAVDKALKAAAEAAAAAPAPDAGGDGNAEALNGALDAMGAEKSEDKGEEDSEDGESSDESAQQEDVASPAAPASNETLTKAMAMLEPARRIRRAAKEAELRRDREPIVFTPISGNSVTSAQYNERIRFRKQRLDDEKAILANLEPCRKDLAALRNSRTLFEREARKILDAIRARKAAEEKERQRNLEAAKKQQEADERAARIQRERDDVASKRMEVEEYVKSFDYDRAVQELSHYTGTYAASEANEDMRNLIDRYKKLAGLRTFILEDLHRNGGLKWGLGQRDIEDADPAAGTITARGGATADVAKLNLKQWMNIINSLVARRDPQRSRVGITQEADLLFGAAIFCLEHGGDNEGAKTMAVNYAKAAIAKSEMVKRDIPRIAPELSSALEESE